MHIQVKKAGMQYAPEMEGQFYNRWFSKSECWSGEVEASSSIDRWRGTCSCHKR